MKLIIGLGNPGKEYDNTRHNIGYMVIDNYVNENVNNSNWKSKFNSKYIDTIINGEKVLLIKPETYMNLSGNAVREFKSFYKINNEDILVIQDDLDLPVGKYRIKTNSSDGGHNGIKSIISNLGTNAFSRLKVGISHNENIETKDYVLGNFSKNELEEISKLYNTFNKIINDFTLLNITEIMNKYNHK